MYTTPYSPWRTHPSQTTGPVPLFLDKQTQSGQPCTQHHIHPGERTPHRQQVLFPYSWTNKHSLDNHVHNTIFTLENAPLTDNRSCSPIPGQTTWSGQPCTQHHIHPGEHTPHRQQALFPYSWTNKHCLDNHVHNTIFTLANALLTDNRPCSLNHGQTNTVCTTMYTTPYSPWRMHPSQTTGPVPLNTDKQTQSGQPCTQHHIHPGERTPHRQQVLFP